MARAAGLGADSALIGKYYAYDNGQLVLANAGSTGKLVLKTVPSVTNATSFSWGDATAGRDRKSVV